MAWQSTVPAAVDGLVNLLSSDATLSPIVRDGPELNQSMANEVVFVGYTGTDEEIVAEGSLDIAGLALAPNRERYSIRGAVIVVNGSSSVSAARSRAYTLFGVVGTTVTSDQTLGGAVMSASLGDWSFSVAQTEEGAVATVTFSVDVDTYTQT